MSFGSKILGFGAFPNREAGYDIEQSLLFDKGDAAYLHRTPGSASNRKTWTWSGWVKRVETHGSNILTLFSADGNSDNSYICFYLDDIYINDYDYDGGGTKWQLTTNAKYRDYSAWYHIVFAVDTTQGTASNRLKLYVNGEQVTSFSTATYPTQNYDGYVNSTLTHKIGSSFTGATAYTLGGYMAEVHFIDGTALTPSSFGETDSATGQWIPKEVKGVTYGTNGFYLKFVDTYPGIVAATGGTITTDGDYKVHTFNSSGTFTVTSTSGGDAAVDFLVIAGGGGGGGYAGAGGGGAGGYRTSYGTSGGGAAAESPLAVTAQAYTVTVGAGGAASVGTSNPYVSTAGGQGANSVFSSVTSIGGGGGGASGGSKPATTGGSGGGGTITSSAAGAAGTANQGYAGGNGVDGGNYAIGGGGGGAGSVGEVGGENSALGDGGSGVASSITGSSVTRAGGGGGAGYTSGYRGEGQHGGGNGASQGETPTAGTANTGGGGGGQGGAWSPSAAGGSGVVIIRYKFQ